MSATKYGLPFGFVTPFLRISLQMEARDWPATAFLRARRSILASSQSIAV